MGKKKIFIAAVMCLLVISVSVQGSNDIRKAKESDKNSDNGIVEKNITINYEKEFCNGIDGIDEPYKSRRTLVLYGSMGENVYRLALYEGREVLFERKWSYDNRKV